MVVSTARSVRLPRLIQLGWCSRGFDELRCATEPAQDERVRVTADAAVEYVDPVASAMLAAWSARWRAMGGHVDIDDSAKSRYAYQIGLLGALAGKPLVGATTDRMVPAVGVGASGQKDLLARIRPVMHLDPDTTEALSYCLSELMNNVFEHAAHDATAYVAASYFPTTDRVTIAVADVGKTIPRDIRDRYEPEHGALDDAAALRAALEPHTSGASADPKNNAGLGLYMTRRFAEVTGGRFWLVSAGCHAHDDLDVAAMATGRGEVTVEPLSNPWPGTVVAVTLRPKTFNYQATMSALQVERTDPFGLKFSKKAVPEGFAPVEVKPDVANMAQDKAVAAAARREIITALGDHEGVAVSLRGVALTTQSYVHALLAEVFEHVGPTNAARRLVFVGCAPQAQTIIRLVARYVFDRM